MPPYQIEQVEKFPIDEFVPAPAAAPAAGPVVDVQPLNILSTLIPGETARVRFTLSNPSSASGTLLHPDTGELPAIDANGHGQLDAPGDVLLSDANQDGFPNLA